MLGAQSRPQPRTAPLIRVRAGSCFVSQPGDKWGWFDSALYSVITNTVLHSAATDVVKAFALLEAAPPAIQWVFVRAPILGNGPLTGGPLRLGDANVGAGSPASTLSRADTARVLLDFAALPELAAAACWTAPAGVTHFLPWFYLAFLTPLLFDRGEGWGRVG